MKAHELKPRMIIVIDGYGGLTEGLMVKTVKPGRFKSSIRITFYDGDKPYDVPRDTECHVCPDDDICEVCEKKGEDGLSYYDNQIFGHSGWMCGDCISTAEMEL